MCRIFYLLLFTAGCMSFSWGQEFTASATDRYVLLQWQFTQLKADHFEVQRRSRGEEFKTISLVLSDETDSVHYRFKDKLTGAESHFYYRIKIFLTNGAEEYSEILSVALNNVHQEPVNIEAASIKGSFIPALPLTKGSYLLRIYDMNGRLLVTQRSSAERPELQAGKLASGKYFMEAYHPQSGKRYYGTFTK